MKILFALTGFSIVGLALLLWFAGVTHGDGQRQETARVDAENQQSNDQAARDFQAKYGDRIKEFAAKYGYRELDAHLLVHDAVLHDLTDRQIDIMNDLQAGPCVVSLPHNVKVFPYHIVLGRPKSQADVIFSDGQTATLVAQ